MWVVDPVLALCLLVGWLPRVGRTRAEGGGAADASRSGPHGHVAGMQLRVPRSQRDEKVRTVVCH